MLGRIVLIPARALQRAIAVRATVSACVIGGLIFAWYNGLVTGWVLTFLCAALLFEASIFGLLWKHERGIWMLHTLLGCFALAGWFYFTFGPRLVPSAW